MDTASQIACERDGGLASCAAIPAVGLPMSPMRSSARGGDGFGRFKLQRAWLTTRRIQWARQHVDVRRGLDSAREGAVRTIGQASQLSRTGMRVRRPTTSVAMLAQPPCAG